MGNLFEFVKNHEKLTIAVFKNREKKNVLEIGMNPLRGFFCVDIRANLPRP